MRELAVDGMRLRTKNRRAETTSAAAGDGRSCQGLLAFVTDFAYSVTLRDDRIKTTHVGAGCEVVTGYPPHAFHADADLWNRIIEAADRPAAVRHIARLLRGETVPPLEHRIHHRTNGVRWVRNTAVPRRDRRGRVSGYDGLVSDVTERKCAELALCSEQERLALVIAGTNDGIWDWDIATGQLYFSPRWKSMLGYEEDELPGRFETWERLLHPEDHDRALAALRNYLAGRAPTYELEHRLRHKDGTYRWILARGVALRDAAGNPVRMAGSHVDLSDRKLAEADLLSAQIRAAKFESIGTLAAGVAHEVKNPLQTIVMGLDYLERRLPAAPAEARAVLQDMRQAMTRANSIVRELLCFAATPRIELQPEDWNALVESSLALLHFEIAASQTALDLRLADGLPPVRVNRQKIQQVFVNLVLNALQAMPAAGRLTLITRLITADADLSRSHPACREFKPGIPLVLTQILDNGPGIAPEHLPRVFDPFFTTRPVGEGTGLGLAVVKKIVELHDGAIDIRNARQGGTLVTLILRAEPKAQL